MLEWLRENFAEVLAWLGVVSIATVVAGIFIVPWLIGRMPADYFAHDRRERLPQGGKPAARVLAAIAKNLIGGFLVLAGVAMLLLPGQGILTILIGLMVMDFPGKYRIERWIVARGPVLRALNAIRAKLDRPPFRLVEDPREED